MYSRSGIDIWTMVAEHVRQNRIIQFFEMFSLVQAILTWNQPQWWHWSRQGAEQQRYNFRVVIKMNIVQDVDEHEELGWGWETWMGTWAVPKDRRALTGPRMMTITNWACVCSRDRREGMSAEKWPDLSKKWKWIFGIIFSSEHCLWEDIWSRNKEQLTG